jgi:hypothetical protein
MILDNLELKYWEKVYKTMLLQVLQLATKQGIEGSNVVKQLPLILVLAANELQTNSSPKIKLTIFSDLMVTGYAG